MKILCLDVGEKRIGLAASDALGITVNAIGTITRTTKQKDFSEILRYLSENNAEKLVIGLPLNEEGEIGVSAKKILKFVKELKGFLHNKKHDMPVETWDERYSTAEAEAYLIGFDVSRKKRKKVIDKMAAVMILRSYMEANS
ncbi:MAG: Holliday junction resolvase RuvX [Deltaproteobacteria bacterium CG07_land_8_20_14_0_80_38_7]|nr:MAG: Holliday junction resolvase RuvX [Deltaproteobacteria bacterium CG07_land_8_20_14_0_80_38_7]